MLAAISRVLVLAAGYGVVSDGPWVECLGLEILFLTIILSS